MPTDVDLALALALSYLLGCRVRLLFARFIVTVTIMLNRSEDNLCSCSTFRSEEKAFVRRLFFSLRQRSVEVLIRYLDSGWILVGTCEVNRSSYRFFLGANKIRSLNNYDLQLDFQFGVIMKSFDYRSINLCYVLQWNLMSKITLASGGNLTYCFVIHASLFSSIL